MLYLRIFLALLISSEAAIASLPYAEVKFNNLIIDKKLKNRINKDWNLFLKDRSHVLHKADTSTKSDQICRFNGQLLESGAIDLNSLKLEKHKQNFNYNLAAIEFLRAGDYKFSLKDPKSKLQITFKYYSF